MRAKRGFTLIEIIVVMGIIAVLATLGVGAIISANRASMVDSAAQDLLSKIREAQNKSISITTNMKGNLPIVWGLNITNTGRNFVSYESSTTPPSLISESSLQPYGANITATISVNGTSYPSVYAVYASPFGRFYLTSNSCVSGCIWTKKISQTGDYAISSPSTNNLLYSGTQNASVTLTLGTYSRKVWLNNNGDTWLE